MRLSILAIAATALSSPAFADSVPHYDVNTYCKEVAGFGGSYSATLDKSCFSMEQSAYNAVKAKWNAIPEDTRKHCDQVASFGGKGSYSLLQSCIGMETEANSENSGRSFKY